MTKFILDSKQEFEQLGVTLICITKHVSSDDFIQNYWKSVDTIYIDPEYDLFRLVGDDSGEFRKFELLDMFTKKFVGQIKTAYDDNHYPDLNFMTQNLILGGSCLVSQQGEVVFRTLEQTVGMLPDINGLLSAAKALKMEGMGKGDYEEAMSPQNLKLMGFDFSKIDH